MEGYSWLDGTGASHTHRQPQSNTVLKCVCVCIHITRTLINLFSMFSSHPLLSFHSFSSHPSPERFSIQCPFFFHHLPFSLSSKVFWPQRIAAGFSILSSLCDYSPSYCSSLCTLPPRQSQLPSTLSNTPVYYTNIQTQAHTHKPSHVHRPTSMHAYTVSMHTRADAYTHTKDILSHFCGMSEGFKKQGCFVITSASAVESVRAG